VIADRTEYNIDIATDSCLVYTHADHGYSKQRSVAIYRTSYAVRSAIAATAELLNLLWQQRRAVAKQSHPHSCRLLLRYVIYNLT